jgi:imidazole glycerol-phosphate synthase subunit HisH
MIAIIDYGAGNTKSLQFALERLGVSSLLTSNEREIRSADRSFFRVRVRLEVP